MKRSRAFWLVLLLIGVPLTGMVCRAVFHRPGPQTVRRTIQVGERERSYLLHRPAGQASQPPPAVVLMFHGGGGDAIGAESMSGFSPLADREGFLAVYPEGVGRGWNDGRDAPGQRAHREGADDLGFVAALLEDLARVQRYDPRRVYATGISNGAIFSHFLAGNRADLVAAIAPVVGGLPRPYESVFAPRQPVSVLVIQGSEDPLVPYDGGAIAGGDRGAIVSTAEAVDRWVRHDQCDTTPVTDPAPAAAPDDGCRVEVRRWTGGQAGTEVVLMRIAGGGHTWPQGPQYLPERTIGRVCQDFHGAETIWRFFAAHPRR